MREAAAIAYPGATVTDVVPEGAQKLPPCAAAIVDGTSDTGAATEVARRIRAGGSRAALLFIVAGRDAGLAARVAPLGVLEQVELHDVARTLGPAIERAMGGEGAWPAALVAARDELRKTQRLMAAGEIALGLQHSMNNPLTAILAEAQLLEMEDLPEETKSAVARIVENTRRLVTLVRTLDAIGPKKQG
ncbi:MAG: hypothetical protein HOQ09_02985 [Gemmatimonadaceae bacterium]|nr:hypothetical protein [Gemmatimonadaceae bacterium]